MHNQFLIEKRLMMEKQEEFDSTIERLKEQKLASDPVHVVRGALAPVRAGAVAALAELDALSKIVRPELDASLEKFNRAVGAGVTNLDYQLYRTIHEGYKILDGTRASLEYVVNLVDNVSMHVITQRHHLRYEGMLNARRAGIGALVTQREKVAVCSRELEARVAEYAVERAPTSATPVTFNEAQASTMRHAPQTKSQIPEGLPAWPPVVEMKTVHRNDR
jgi:hypothetical protein